MQRPSVVKTVFARGVTDEYGALKVKIEEQDANLALGRWRMCVDSLIVSPLNPVLKSLPIRVGATHTFFTCQLPGWQHKVTVPATQALFVLPLSSVNIPFLAVQKRTKWLEVQNPSNTFSLVFQNAENDKPLWAKVQVLLLIERIAEKH